MSNAVSLLKILFSLFWMDFHYYQIEFKFWQIDIQLYPIEFQLLKNWFSLVPNRKFFSTNLFLPWITRPVKGKGKWKVSVLYSQSSIKECLNGIFEMMFG